jgi:hypothetical protein
MGLRVTVNVAEPPNTAVAGLGVGFTLRVKFGARTVVGSLPELGAEPPPETLT